MTSQIFTFWTEILRPILPFNLFISYFSSMFITYHLCLDHIFVSNLSLMFMFKPFIFNIIIDMTEFSSNILFSVSVSTF